MEPLVEVAAVFPEDENKESPNPFIPPNADANPLDPLRALSEDDLSADGFSAMLLSFEAAATALVPLKGFGAFADIGGYDEEAEIPLELELCGFAISSDTEVGASVGKGGKDAAGFFASADFVVVEVLLVVVELLVAAGTGAGLLDFREELRASESSLWTSSEAWIFSGVVPKAINAGRDASVTETSFRLPGSEIAICFARF